MSEPAFLAAVEQLIVPVLEPHGFQRVRQPHGWFSPEVLLESRNRWFAASFDWRDRCLEASLGRLFLFRDVLPRVIVHGISLSHGQRTGGTYSDFVHNALGQIASHLPELLERFDELYARSIDMSEMTASPNKAVRKAAREFSRFMGPELTLEQWRQLADVDYEAGQQDH